VEDAVLKLHGIEPENKKNSALQVNRCPRCHQVNPGKQGYCGTCGLPLNDEVREQLEKDTAAVDMAIWEAIAADPRVLQLLNERLKEFQNNNNKG
jgi:uncharacterized paraquat-inducible protein A